jgi:GDP-L-fucose synthase
VIAEVTGYEGAVRWDRSRPNGQPRQRLDTSRAAHLLAFHASIPLAEGLEDTVRWYERAVHRSD